MLVWFVLVFGHCHNVAAKGLEQQCNLQRSLVPKRERQRKRGNRERETKRERERAPQGLSNQETWQPFGSQL